MEKKIFKIAELLNKIKKLKIKNKKIGLCHGAFDLIHIGHIKHFKSSKKQCDFLIVSITRDEFIKKGPKRPIFNEKLRIETLAELSSIDAVILSEGPTAENIIQTIKPNFYFKGPDYKKHKNDLTNKINIEINLVKKYKGKVIYTSDEKYSSSKIINQNFSILNDDQKKLVKYIKNNFDFLEIKKVIDEFENLKPLIIGETIIDQYYFCEALGKSGKDPFLAFREIYNEKYLGGAGLITRHLSSFCKKTFFLTSIGEKADNINYIKKKLPKNIDIAFFNKKNSPTIIKKRFLDVNTKSKLFGVYDLNDELVSPADEKKFINLFIKKRKKTNLTIIADYGHGLITKKIAAAVKKNTNFIAANVQINAANKGYHSLFNYKNINCVIINEAELRSEMRNREDGINILIKKLSNKLSLKYLAVTRGSKGIILYDSKNKKFFNSPAFEFNAIDKIGAGDTILSMLSICIFKKIDLNLALYISSLAAALSVRVIGNKFSITKENLLKYISHTLN
tara:strand:- start:940 stop:2463 length:1524 start_codon:yes stop_codon:yes gene_type:complete